MNYKLRIKNLFVLVLTVSVVISDSAFAGMVSTLPNSVSSDAVLSTDVTNDALIDSVSLDPVSQDTVSQNSVSSDSVSSDSMSTDSISVNSVSVNSLSANQANETIQIQIEILQSSLKKLLSERDVMALVYLADAYDLKNESDTASSTIVSVPSGQLVFIRNVEMKDGKVWYQVDANCNDTSYIGYIERNYLAYSDELFIAWEQNELEPLLLKMNQDVHPYNILPNTYTANGIAASYQDINQFPTSYRGKLTTLKNAHPNWIFVPMNTALNWNNVVDAEMTGDRSWIYKTAPPKWRGAPRQENWYLATRPAVEHYLDPRNFLSDKYIFQFEQLTYNQSYHTTDAVQKILQSTFMSGNIPDGSNGSYAQAFWDLGRQLDVSPFHLASRVYQEQGTGTSPLISGEGYQGQYAGYYNYFNVGASGSSSATVILNGLKYAKDHGWNTRRLSLAGGASTIGNNYIKKGQDTLYLQKWDLVGTLYTHQYMQNIQAPSSEAQKTRSAYLESGSINSTFVFKVPVFNDMPSNSDTSYTLTSSATINRGNTKKLALKVDGTTVDNNTAKWSSSDSSIASVDDDGIVTAIAPGKATISALIDGETLECKVTVIVKLESISLNKADGILEADETDLLTVSYTPADTTESTKVTWKSANTKLATVSISANSATDAAKTNAAIVKAIAPGTTTITATVGTFKQTYVIDIVAPIKSVNITPKKEMFRGESSRLTYTYTPANTTNDTTVTWKSSDDNVVIVDDTGLIKAVGSGKATITASMKSVSKANEETMLSANCDITVETCVVTYHDVSGNVISANGIQKQEYDYHDTLGTLLPAPALPSSISDNQVFVGWFDESNGKGNKCSESTLVRGNMDLYPYFMPTAQGFFIEEIGNQTYTGSRIKPEVHVYAGASEHTDMIELIRNKDYTVSYQNNIKVNDASIAKKAPTITITGKGNYSGTQTKLFKITPKNINDTDIVAIDLMKTYTGKKQFAVPTLTRGKTKLTNKTHFTVSYPETIDGAYTDIGTHAITVTGKGGYTGTRIVYMTITDKTFLKKVTFASIKNQIYTGNPITPTLKLKRGSVKLIEGVDYTTDYTNTDNVNIGKVTVTVIGKGNYIGKVTKTFKIVGTSITKAKVSGIENYTYRGISNETIYKQSNYILTIGSGDKKLTLKEGEDFTVSYLKHSRVGTATILFTGKNAFFGTLKKTYKIRPYDIKNNVDRIFISDTSDISIPYSKGGVKPKVTLSVTPTATHSVSYAAALLVEGVDYTLSYKNNTAVYDDSNPKKVPTITIRGKGNYTGSITKPFVITTQDFSEELIEISAADVTYQNKTGKYKSTPILKDKSTNKKLTAKNDYQKQYLYSYDENVTVTNQSVSVERAAGDVVDENDIIPAGARIRVTVTGTGNYTSDTISTTYRICAQSIAKAKVTVKKQVFIGKDNEGNGIAICPGKEDITVKVGKTILNNDDYEIVGYKNNTKRGTATVLLKGIDNYGKTRTAKFTIGRLQIKWWWEH